MRQLLFIGHKFHLKTGSSLFIQEILAKHFHVNTVAVDPEDLSDTKIAAAGTTADIVFIWQMDYLAPLFLSQGKRTVVAPMYDGSGELPGIHWEISNQARFISFSRKLHVNIQRAGGTSLLVKYFPKPSTDARPLQFDQIDAFFWQRRPDHGIDLSFVERLLGSQARSIHLHDAPDIPRPPQSKAKKQYKTDIGVAVHTSEWFRSRSEYTQALEKANVFIAPRLTEGIGMGFLEAMARGMVVFAHDASTHNEYICNWVNGVLFHMNIQGQPHLDRSVLVELGGRARQSVSDGRAQWEKSIPRLIEFIETAPTPKNVRTDAELLARELPQAYQAGVPTYTSYLRRNLGLVRSLSPGLDGRRATRLKARSSDADSLAVYEELKSTRLEFGNGSARAFLGRGWSEDEQLFVWMIERSAVISFSVKQEYVGLSVMKIVSHCSPSIAEKQQAAFVLNGALAGLIEIGKAPMEQFLAMPDPGLATNNTLQIFVDQFGGAQPDPRTLTIAIHFIEFC